MTRAAGKVVHLTWRTHWYRLSSRFFIPQPPAPTAMIASKLAVRSLAIVVVEQRPITDGSRPLAIEYTCIRWRTHATREEPTQMAMAYGRRLLQVRHPSPRSLYQQKLPVLLPPFLPEVGVQQSSYRQIIGARCMATGREKEAANPVLSRPAETISLGKQRAQNCLNASTTSRAGGTNMIKCYDMVSGRPDCAGASIDSGGYCPLHQLRLAINARILRLTRAAMKKWGPSFECRQHPRELQTTGWIHLLESFSVNR